MKTSSYSTLGIVSQKHFLEICRTHPKLHNEMLLEIVQNPYDAERDQFVKICKSRISYFKDIDDEILKNIYYRTK